MAAQWNLPLGAAESEAVRQLSTECLPEIRLLLIFKLEKLIVVVLHLLMFFGDVGAVAVFSSVPLAATTTATTSTAASATTSASATLRKLASLYIAFEIESS